MNLFVASGSMKKIFTIDLCQYQSFLDIFPSDFVLWKSVGLPNIFYIVIH